MWEALAVVASVIMNRVMGGGEQEQPQQMAGSLYQPTQLPQAPPFMPSGLPQQPQYGQQPPAITQFQNFQPLFPRQQQRRLGQ